MKIRVSGMYNRIIFCNIILIVILLLLSTYVLCFNRLDFLFGEELELSGRLKFFGWIIGGCIAIIGISYSGKRTKHFEYNLHETQLNNVLKLLSDGNSTVQVMGFSALIRLGEHQIDINEKKQIYGYIHDYLYMELLEEGLSVKNEQCVGFLVGSSVYGLSEIGIKKHNMYIDLSECRLKGAKLADYHLEWIDFRGADVDEVQWTGSKLDGAKFSMGKDGYLDRLLSNLSEEQQKSIRIYGDEWEKGASGLDLEAVERDNERYYRIK